jgi:DNA topoisomerase-1
VNHDGVNATLPSDMTPEAITLEQAIGLIDARAGSGGGKSARSSKGKKTAAKTPAKAVAEPRSTARKAPAKSKAAPKPKAAAAAANKQPRKAKAAK